MAESLGVPVCGAHDTQVAGVTVGGADNPVVSVNCFLHVVDDGGARMVGMDGRAL